MQKIHATVLLCCLLICASFVGSAYLLKGAIERHGNAPASNRPVSLTDSQEPSGSYTGRTVMTIEDLAEYLQVSPQEIQNQLNADGELEKQFGPGIHDKYVLIPYIKLFGGAIRFNKAEIDEWLKYKYEHR
ncbi:helix-turn-helix domain-containing protein [Gorillibacterium sp. sgz500922]|uniref:helix-turn-helix domain-containing protein n=1 Tax=Gorillibacterium sp. sgz500922 TaxID=3446694 RepID=UPI003F678FF0